MEMSAVIGIIAILVGMTMSAGVTQLDIAKHQGTKQSMEVVRQALNLFQKKYGRYPCPADPALATSHANYGVEYNSGSCTAACPLGGLSCGTNAVIGMVPFKALGINEGVAYDAWDRRITYAVDKNHTATSEYADGSLSVQDGSGNEITASAVLGKAIFILASHGEDGNGGYSKKALVVKACGATAKDIENCDYNDDIFVSPPFNNGTVAASFSDDLIAWQVQENVDEEAEEEEEETAWEVDYGLWHICVKKPDGTAWCQGENDTYQLGDGTNTDRNAWVQVTNVSDVTQISLAPQFTYALQADGTAICWGDDFPGFCGNGPGNSGQGDAVTVTGLTYVTGYGYDHTCAIKSDATLWCWGDNGGGELGDNTTTTRDSAVQVKGVGGAGFLTGIVDVAVGNDHTCAVKDDGTAWCWGDNPDGRLGDNTTVDKHTPVQVLGTGAVGFLTGVSKIAAGGSDSCAVKDDGTVWCWGANEAHQHATNNFTDHRTPVQVAGLSGIEQIEAGSTGVESHFCALKNDDTMWCWGNNSTYQTGGAGMFTPILRCKC